MNKTNLDRKKNELHTECTFITRKEDEEKKQKNIWEKLKSWLQRILSNVCGVCAAEVGKRYAKYILCNCNQSAYGWNRVSIWNSLWEYPKA